LAICSPNSFNVISVSSKRLAVSLAWHWLGMAKKWREHANHRQARPKKEWKFFP
jgi:hypothetical protein